MRNGKNLKKKKKSASVTCRGHIWIDGNEGTFIGYGRVALLEKILECGSITQAAKLLKISYRHAWELIDSMNRQARKPFIETVTGGKGGGGTRLTKEGEQAIEYFWQFHRKFQDFLEHENKIIGSFINTKKEKRI
jgi:molybdate transport system regulatory protein